MAAVQGPGYASRSSDAPAEVLAERPVRAIPVPTTTTDTQLTSRPCLLVGWSLRETTAAAVAAVQLFSGGSTGGVLVGEQALASGGTGSHQVAPDGVLCEGGLFLDVLSGSVAGVVYVRI